MDPLPLLASPLLTHAVLHHLLEEAASSETGAHGFVGIGGGLSGMAYLASGLQSPSLPAAQLVAPAYVSCKLSLATRSAFTCHSAGPT